jgi:hypothetical protein
MRDIIFRRKNRSRKGGGREKRSGRKGGGRRQGNKKRQERLGGMWQENFGENKLFF